MDILHDMGVSSPSQQKLLFFFVCFFKVNYSFNADFYGARILVLDISCLFMSLNQMISTFT